MMHANLLMSIIQETARNMMDGVGEAGLIIDGRKLFFEYRYDYTSFRVKKNFSF